MSDDGAIRRALESIRSKRRISFSAAEDEYSGRKHQREDEVEDMSNDVLNVLKELRGEAFEALGLYTGAGEGKVTLYERYFSRNELQFREEFRIGGPGLTYELTGPEEGVQFFKDLLNRGETRLDSPSDFGRLNYDSIRNFHTVVMSEDFVEKLAWRSGRKGKPGYTENSFEEEQLTWKVANEDSPRRVSSREDGDK